eukprot:PhF_6_TR42949/c0_g3_i1/m.65301
MSEMNRSWAIIGFSVLAVTYIAYSFVKPEGFQGGKRTTTSPTSPSSSSSNGGDLTPPADSPTASATTVRSPPSPVAPLESKDDDAKSGHHPYIFPPPRNRYPKQKIQSIRSDEYDKALNKHQSRGCAPPDTLSKSFEVHGFGGGGDSAEIGVTRFWVESISDDNNKAQCVGGDAYDIIVYTDTLRIAPYQIVDLENGLYEVIVVLPLPGEYTVCVDMLLTQGHLDSPYSKAFTNNLTVLGTVVSNEIFGYVHDNKKKYCVKNPTEKRWCYKGTYSKGTPLDRTKYERCSVLNKDGGKSEPQGYWYKPPEGKCSPGVCEGIIPPSYEG